MLGDASPVAVMGVINVSPESFHAGSVYHGDAAVLKAALGMVEAGAALIDVGARSSAPRSCRCRCPLTRPARRWPAPRCKPARAS